MQIAARVAAIHVPDVLHRAHAEHIEVEMRVARDERIVRPVDDARAQLCHCAPLEFLQPPTDAEVLRFGAHRQHVGPVHDDAVLDARHAVHEADQPAAGGERAGRDAAELL